jgi:hypothetical protein
MRTQHLYDLSLSRRGINLLMAVVDNSTGIAWLLGPGFKIQINRALGLRTSSSRLARDLERNVEKICQLGIPVINASNGWAETLAGYYCVLASVWPSSSTASLSEAAPRVGLIGLYSTVCCMIRSMHCPHRIPLHLQPVAIVSPPEPSKHWHLAVVLTVQKSGDPAVVL